MLMVAIVLAAALPQPSVGISGGPILFREAGRAGVGSGPLMRVDIGYPIAERAAAELWLTGAMESAPPTKPGDRALVAAGGGARLLVARLDSEERVLKRFTLGLEADAVAWRNALGVAILPSLRCAF
jgi:hypothetical protein